MWHPFNHLPRRWQLPLLALVFLLTLIVGWKTNQPLKPFRIVSLELAPTPEAAQIIIDAWKKVDPLLDAARLVQYWDTYFILCYSTLLALGCFIVADRLYSLEATANFHGKLVAWLMWVAGILDYVENYAINKMLDGAINTTWQTMSEQSASFKFLIVGTGVTYIITGFLVGLLHRRRDSR